MATDLPILNNFIYFLDFNVVSILRDPISLHKLSSVVEN